MEVWFLLAVVVVFFWGVSQIFSKYSTDRLGVARIALLIAAVEGPLYATGFLLLHGSFDFSFQDGLLAAASCLIGVMGFLCFFESVIDGQVAIAGTISAAYPALTVVGAVVILSESLAAIQAFGVLLIIGGVVAVSYEPDPGAKHAITKHSLTFAFLAFLGWGVWSLTSKVAVDAVGPGNLFGFYVLSSVTAPLIYASFRRMKRPTKVPENPTRLAWGFGAIALALNVLGAFAYTYALEKGNASLVGPASSAYPIVTIVLAVAILKEKVHKTQIIWLGCVCLGLLLVGISA